MGTKYSFPFPNRESQMPLKNLQKLFVSVMRLKCAQIGSEGNRTMWKMEDQH